MVRSQPGNSTRKREELVHQPGGRKGPGERASMTRASCGHARVEPSEESNHAGPRRLGSGFPSFPKKYEKPLKTLTRGMA